MRWRAWVFFAAGVVVGAPSFVLPGTGAADVARAVVGLGAALVIARAARRSGPTAGGWGLIAAAVALFTIGDALSADTPTLVGYPTLALGIVLLLRARGAGALLDGLFDGSIIALGASVAAWEGLIEQAVTSSAPFADRLISVTYTTMDILLLTAVASLALTDTRTVPAYRLLFAGVTAMLAADVAQATSQVSGADIGHEWFQGAWLLSYVLLGCAALHPTMRTVGEQAERPSSGLGPVRATVLSLSLLAGPVTLVMEGGSGMDPLDGPVILFLFTIVMLLVLARLWGLLAGKDRTIEERAHEALHDALTGLPNRVLFLDRLQHALRRSERSGEGMAVFFLDIDHFKLVNDTAGHAVGDQLLQTVADRLCSAVRGADTVARFAGDEFTVLCEGVQDEVGAAVVANRILEALAPPVPLPELDLHLSASIGVALSAGRERIEAHTLLRDADTAMYQAKERGRGCHEVFDEAMRDRAVSRLAIEDALRRALDEGQFSLHYQPEITLGTGELFGVEALLRWRHPEHGMVSPAEFLPVAEESGLIVPIGQWVLRAACEQARRWQESLGAGAPAVAVNLSPRQLSRSDVAADVAAALEETGLDPRLLYVEVTETVVVEDADAARATLVRLKELGVSVAMDDFGTGYSSLSHLRELPVDVVKIDRSFVSGIGTSPGDAALVEAVIGMARALGLLTVAEGVETEEQAEMLRARGCDIVQGYFYGRPAPAEEVLGVLASA